MARFLQRAKAKYSELYAASPSIGATWTQTRNLNVHEHQAADILREGGVNVPRGEAASTEQEVEQAAEKVTSGNKNAEVVVKAQVLAGGRGLGRFLNGFEGGVHTCKASEASEVASKMIGQTLVTKQTGEKGKPCNKVYVCEKVEVEKEMYLAILLDRQEAAPVVIGSAGGGTSIEELAKTNPEKIVKRHIDYDKGVTTQDMEAIIETLGVTGDLADAMRQIRALSSIFVAKDLTQLEINPMVEDGKGRMLAADAKLTVDDNAGHRQKEIFQLRDKAQEDMREVRAGEYELNYIGLEGNIGCMVNGAGLAMATMDIISVYGGSPANFLDVGGSATEEQIFQAFNILTGDEHVRAILVNIFGGIMHCDVIASGILRAASELGLSVPLIVRLEGTNVELARDILRSSALNITPADDLDDAAHKAVSSL